jgi:hypothetical protein
MTFDPNRCGSSPVSADTCGDTPCSKSSDRELTPATDSRDRSARSIVPAYLASDQEALVGFVRQYLSFLRATSLNRMIKAIEKPQNKLFNRLYPEILNIENGSYWS